MAAINGGGSGAPAPAPLSPEVQAVFRESIGLVLSRWSALRMAVENEWGGRNSHLIPDQLASDIFSWFTLSKEPLYIDDLENILLDGMLLLNTEIDDGSVEEVAEKLMIMHEECSQGNYSSVQKLREASLPPLPSHTAAQASSDSDSDDDDGMEEDDSPNMIVEAPRSQPNLNSANTPSTNVPDADGWTVVGSKKKGGRRN